MSCIHVYMHKCCFTCFFKLKKCDYCFCLLPNTSLILISGVYFGFLSQFFENFVLLLVSFPVPLGITAPNRHSRTSTTSHGSGDSDASCRISSPISVISFGEVSAVAYELTLIIRNIMVACMDRQSQSHGNHGIEVKWWQGKMMSATDGPKGIISNLFYTHFVFFCSAFTNHTTKERSKPPALSETMSSFSSRIECTGRDFFFFW